jgi:hypothetical protein
MPNVAIKLRFGKLDKGWNDSVQIVSVKKLADRCLKIGVVCDHVKSPSGL